jgi:hypothetical protein
MNSKASPSVCAAGTWSDADEVRDGIIAPKNPNRKEIYWLHADFSDKFTVWQRAVTS